MWVSDRLHTSLPLERNIEYESRWTPFVEEKISAPPVSEPRTSKLVASRHTLYDILVTICRVCSV